MSQNIELSVAEILSKIDNRLDRLEGKIDKLDNKIDQVEAKLESKIDQVEAKLESKIDKLGEQINKVQVSVGELNAKSEGLDKRLSNLEFVYRGAGVAIIGAILLAVFRYLFPNVIL